MAHRDVNEPNLSLPEEGGGTQTCCPMAMFSSLSPRVYAGDLIIHTGGVCAL